ISISSRLRRDLFFVSIHPRSRAAGYSGQKITIRTMQHVGSPQCGHFWILLCDFYPPSQKTVDVSPRMNA
ncbi:MAG: hypothetical protein AAB844_01480, partial [Patescibacteria group bacterium]